MKLAAWVAIAFLSAPVMAQQADHKRVLPEELKWSDVPTLPKGAQAAVIEGPMNQPVPFTVRLKFPANYKLPPHAHPAVERVTVLSGTFNLGLGKQFEQSKTDALRPGSMMILQPGTPHFAWTSTETIVQIHGTGPWSLSYVNPADDPRKP